MKIISRIIMLTITISLLFIVSNNVFDNASAESYESGVGVSFTLNPSISVTVSGDLAIANLTPGDYKDSNNITVTASSNSIAGYSLSSTVGSSTNTSTELRKDGVDTTNKFSSITTNKASLSNFDDSTNTWGYSYSTDSGTTWQSGDITGTPATGYNGLPLYTSSNSIKLINSTTSGSSSVLFKIGARTTTNQIAGEYTNVINFIGVANPNPPIVYMQNATLADCGKDMVDSRDNTIYTTALLADGKCWMTENLALDPTTLTQAQLYGTAEHPLTNASNTTLGYLKNGGGSSPYTAYPVTKADNTDYFDKPMVATSGTCYSAFCVNDPSSSNWQNTSVTQPTINGVTSIVQGKIGVYYNYCAASAGSYCYSESSSSGNAMEDLCPAGWRMPTGGSSGEFQNLYNQYSSGNPSQVAAFQIALNTPLSGNFASGTARGQGNYNNLWGSTRSTNLRMHRIDVGSNTVEPNANIERKVGLSLRCILK